MTQAVTGRESPSPPPGAESGAARSIQHGGFAEPVIQWLQASTVVLPLVPTGFGPFLGLGSALLPRPYVEDTRWIAYAHLIEKSGGAQGIPVFATGRLNIVRQLMRALAPCSPEGEKEEEPATSVTHHHPQSGLPAPTPGFLQDSLPWYGRC